MATKQLSNSKTLCVLGVVVCCFAILWPKIFLPMFQSAMSMTSANPDKPKDDSLLLPPRVREAMKLSRPHELPIQRLSGRPLLDNKMDDNENPNRTGGLMGFLMPVYTIIIIVFFVYTILWMLLKKDPIETVIDVGDEDKTTRVLKPDFHMDREYRKFILSDEYNENGERIKNIKEIKREAQFISKTLYKSKTKKIKPVLSDYDSNKVSQALRLLIRDMEAFKTKDIKTNEKQDIPSTKPEEEEEEDNKENVINKSEKEINERTDKTEDQEEVVKEDCNETTDKCNNNSDNSNDESNEDDIKESDFCYQNDIKTDETLDLDNKYGGDDDNEDNIHKDLRNCMDSDIWSSLLKSMINMDKLKEE